MPPLTLPLEPGVQRLLAAIRAAGGRPLVVGGAVRDAVLGLVPKDVDVEVYGLPADPLAAALAGVGKVNAVGKSFGVLKVTFDGATIDVALPRRENKQGRGHKGFMVAPDATMTPAEAAARRDYTINAMAWDPATEELLDFFGGQDDARRRVLRHVGPAFAEDPLRVLRGMQFAARFDCTVDPATAELARTLAPEYGDLPVERVWDEWWKWASKSAHPGAGLRFLEACGWMAHYPELVALDGCPQEPEWHPEGDVLTHTALVTDAAAAVAVRDGLAAEDRGVLVLAALVHDLGKPETTAVTDGRIRSIGHTNTRETFRAFLARVGAPARVVERVVALCVEHLVHIGFSGSARQVRRLATRLGAAGETIATLARLVEADHDGRPPLPGGLPDDMRALLDVAREVSAAETAPVPLLLGRHLIEMGVAPGPAMGRWLQAAYEAQLDGAFDTLDGARAWIAARL